MEAWRIIYFLLVPFTNYQFYKSQTHLLFKIKKKLKIKLKIKLK